MQQVFRTRPPEGSQIDFILPGLLVLGFLFIGLAVWALGYVIVGAALSGWAACGLLFIQFRAWEFNRWVWMAGNPVIVEQPEPAPEIRTQPMEITRTEGGANYRFTPLDLMPEDWQRLAHFVISKNGISRDGLLRLKIKWPTNKTPKDYTPDNVTYYDYWMELWGSGVNGAGYFDGLKLTEKGRRFFGSYLSPTPPPTSESTPAHETTKDETTKDGGEQ